MLINSLIPHEAGYNARIDPASVERVLSRMVTAKRFKGHKGIEEGKTLTEMEATWGEKYVELGLKRGDIRINEAGLCVVRREIATDGQGVVESKSLQVQGTVDKGVDDSQQDKLFEEIKMWASSKSQQLDDTSTKQYKSDTKSEAGSSSSGGVSSNTMNYLQNAYDMCSAAVRKGKSLAKSLREV